MSQGISYREFGRRYDLSGEGVRKAVATGRIPPEAVGEITLSSGRKRPCITNPELAARSLKLNTTSTQQRDKKVISEGVKRGRYGKGKGAAGGAGGSPPPMPPTDPNRRTPTINESKAITEAYRARLAKLEYEEKSGKLVDAEQVKLEMTNMITAAKSKLLAVPSKARGRLAHLTVGDVELLEEMISEALEELASGN